MRLASKVRLFILFISSQWPSLSSSSVPLFELRLILSTSTGGAVLRALQALPTPPKLRALSRNPDSPAALKLKEQGIEVVKGSLNDVASLTAALQGAQSAFLGTSRSLFFFLTARY